MKKYRGAHVRKSYRKTLYMLCDETCIACGRQPKGAFKVDYLTLDHLDNDKNNNDWRNLVPMCHNCNNKKGSADWQSFLSKEAKLRYIAYASFPDDMVKELRRRVKRELEREARINGTSMYV